MEDHIWFCKTAVLSYPMDKWKSKTLASQPLRYLHPSWKGMQTLVVTVCWGCIAAVFLHQCLTIMKDDEQGHQRDK